MYIYGLQVSPFVVNLMLTYTIRVNQLRNTTLYLLPYNKQL